VANRVKCRRVDKGEAKLGYVVRKTWYEKLFLVVLVVICG
jgi:hypothetical protein